MGAFEDIMGRKRGGAPSSSGGADQGAVSQDGRNGQAERGGDSSAGDGARTGGNGRTLETGDGAQAGRAAGGVNRPVAPSAQALPDKLPYPAEDGRAVKGASASQGDAGRGSQEERVRAVSAGLRQAPLAPSAQALPDRLPDPAAGNGAPGGSRSASAGKASGGSGSASAGNSGSWRSPLQMAEDALRKEAESDGVDRLEALYEAGKGDRKRDEAEIRAAWERFLADRKPQTQEEKAKEEKKRKRDALFSAIGDGISSLANLYFTTQYAPDSSTPGSLSKRMRERWEKLTKERGDKDKEYMNVLLNRYNFGKDAARDDMNWRMLFERMRQDRNARRAAAEAAAAEAAQKQGNVDREFAFKVAKAKTDKETEAERLKEQKRHNMTLEALTGRRNDIYERNASRTTAGSGKGRTRFTLEIEGKIHTYDNEEDYRRAVNRYARRYGVDAYRDETTIKSMGPRNYVKERNTVRKARPISEIAAEVEEMANLHGWTGYGSGGDGPGVMPSSEDTDGDGWSVRPSSEDTDVDNWDARPSSWNATGGSRNTGGGGSAGGGSAGGSATASGRNGSGKKGGYKAVGGGASSDSSSDSSHQQKKKSAGI